MSVNFSSRSEIETLKKIADGGEASIYEYYNNKVIKLFKKGIDLNRKENKVKYFISIKDKLSSRVMGPQEDVTVRNKFIAYLMNKLVGGEDLHMLTKKKYLVANNLTNKDVVEILVDLGRELKKLHLQKILVGDVSDYNFQMVGKCAYFVDVDSWGVDGKFSPDAYTEMFTCPESYIKDGTIKFSIENEYYNFAVLSFYMLTRIHPFGGKYLPEEKMSILERMKRKISVVGKYKKDIKIPKIIDSWNWISPELLQAFIDIFENGRKIDITPYLENLLGNMKHCSVHNMYYYSKYSECPICNEKAKLKVAPIITDIKTDGKGPKVTVVFDGSDCAYILSNVHYLSTNNEVIHFETGRKVILPKGKRVDFSKDGKIVFVTDDSTIKIYGSNNQLLSILERSYRSNYLVQDKYLYYVDEGSNLVKLEISERGNLPTYFGKVYNPLFSVSNDGKLFVASMYPKKAIIRTEDYTFEVKYSGKINEYAIKYDKKTNSWAFIYQLSNGKFRTMIFNKNNIVYDDDTLMYNAIPLSNICFYNNTIYDPSDGEIIGTNIIKNRAGKFVCDIVDESSKLVFDGRGFKIYNKNNIYNYG